MVKQRLLAISLVAVGCRVPTEHAAQMVLTADRSEYVAHNESRDVRFPLFGFTMVTHLENRGDAAAFLPRCTAGASTPTYGIALLDPVDPDGSAFNPVWGCVGVPPIRLEPGSSRVDTLHIVGPTIWKGGGGPYVGRLSGRMRLSYVEGASVDFTVTIDSLP